jgi:hypothetical protein
MLARLLFRRFEHEVNRFRAIFPKTPHQYFAAGNHDVGRHPKCLFHNDSHPKVNPSLTRFEREFGSSMTWHKMADNHCLAIINVISFGAVNCEYGRAEFWKQLNRISVELLTNCPLSSHTRTLLVHYPLPRPQITFKCTAGHTFTEGRVYHGENWHTRELTSRILTLLQPSLVLSGDFHGSCYYEHVLDDGVYSNVTGGATVVPEWIVTSINPLMGTQFPGLGILSLRKMTTDGNFLRHSQTHMNNGAVSFHHCLLCPVLWSAAGHGVAAVASMLHLYHRYMRPFLNTLLPL